MKRVVREFFKNCKNCNQHLPESCYGVNRSGKLGRKARCYRCVRDEWWKSQYGVGCEYVMERMKAQRGRCGVCKTPLELDLDRPDRLSSTRAVLDYDRMTHHPRGVICVKCSTTLGMMEDDTDLMKKILRYVQT